MKFSKEQLKRALYFLLIVTGVLGIWYALRPALPEISWRIETYADTHSPFEPKVSVSISDIESTFASAAAFDSTTSSEYLNANTSSFSIQIPAIGVDMPIIVNETNADTALNAGAWHIPGSADPDSVETRKNMVLAAHRFMYTSGPHTFYHLDKLSSGDDIYITWRGLTHHYKMKEQSIVAPDAVEILEDTKNPRLTLFTCHPVFSTKERLVVTAELAQ